MDSSEHFKELPSCFSRILRNLLFSRGHTLKLAHLMNDNAATVDNVLDANYSSCTQKLDTNASLAVASPYLWPCESLFVITRQRPLLRYENYRRRFMPSFVAYTAFISIPWLDFQVQS